MPFNRQEVAVLLVYSMLGVIYTYCGLPNCNNQKVAGTYRPLINIYSIYIHCIPNQSIYSPLLCF